MMRKTRKLVSTILNSCHRKVILGYFSVCCRILCGLVVAVCYVESAQGFILLVHLKKFEVQKNVSIESIGKVQNIVMLAVLCFRSAWVPQATNLYLRVTEFKFKFIIFCTIYK